MEAWLIFIPVAIVAALSIWWHFDRSRRVLEQWASGNGYQLLYSEYRHLRKGPFLLRAGRGHAVYYVTVRDESGRTRSGYVRCGSWWLGLWSDQVTVEWVD